MRLDYREALGFYNRHIRLTPEHGLETVFWSSLRTMVNNRFVTAEDYYIALENLVWTLSDYNNPIPGKFPVGRDLIRIFERCEMEIDKFLSEIIKQMGIANVQGITHNLKNYGRLVEYVTPTIKTKVTYESCAKIMRVCFLLFITAVMNTAKLFDSIDKEV